MDFHHLTEKLRDQFWLIPALIICALIALLSWTIQLPPFRQEETFWSLFLEGSSPEGARLILNAIATAIMTVVGVLFSLTIVVLQQASNQYSPRAIETFIRSYASQTVLGFYLGTFAYCLLLLRQIHEGSQNELPQTAISVAIGLTGICTVMLIFYINHLAHAVKSTSIITNIEKETLHYLKSFMQDLSKVGPPALIDPPFSQKWQHCIQLTSSQSGYLQSINFRKIRKCLSKTPWEIEVHFAPGDYVDQEIAIATIRSQEELPQGSLRRLYKAFSIGSSRNHAQDPLYGIRQLADIALRALSPGINDPTTAMEALNRIGTILKYFTIHCEMPQAIQLCPHGRILLTRVEYVSIVETCFQEISSFAESHPRVQNRIRGFLESIGKEARKSERREVCLKMLNKLSFSPTL